MKGMTWADSDLSPLYCGLGLAGSSNLGIFINEKYISQELYNH